MIWCKNLWFVCVEIRALYWLLAHTASSDFLRTAAISSCICSLQTYLSVVDRFFRRPFLRVRGTWLSISDACILNISVLDLPTRWFVWLVLVTLPNVWHNDGLPLLDLECLGLLSALLGQPLLLYELVAIYQDWLRKFRRANIVHLLVMYEHLRWKTLEDPHMLEGFIWCHPIVWIPNQALFDEILEVRILISNDERQRLAHGLSKAATRVLAHDGLNRLAIGRLCEELLFAARHGEHSRVWHANHLHQTRHLVILAVSREDWVPDIKLSHDAAERPHINCAVVGYAEHNFGCPVESRLDVSIDALVQES